MSRDTVTFSQAQKNKAKRWYEGMTGYKTSHCNTAAMAQSQWLLDGMRQNVMSH